LNSTARNSATLNDLRGRRLSAVPRRALGGGLMLLAALSLSACGDAKEKKPGQALAKVNGTEITVLQLNEELQRAGPQGQQEGAKKQLLDALIDRQLLQDEAVKEKLERDPKVMQAVERAKALIIAQAYMQKRVGTPVAPTKAEVETYFNDNPGFFTQRKQFDMRELIIETKDMTDAVKAQMDSSKSLDEVATWLQANNIKFARAQLSRTSADLPPELTTKLLAMPKGQLFVIREGARSMLLQIADIKDAPVTLATATPQIEQFLLNKRNKETAEGELKRLRAAAKIDYLQPTDAPKAAGTAPAAPAAPASQQATAPADANNNEATARGVAGLK